MNKLLKIVFIMFLIGLLAACGTKDNDDTAKDNDTNKTTENTNGTDVGTTNDNAGNGGATDNNIGNDGTTNDTHKVELADEVADKITELQEVESASVLVTDNNAYVAVDLSEGVDETEDLKAKISDAAKAGNANFNNVYVSANPDFSKQFKDYGERIRANEPVEGFFDEFTDTVKRVFPDQAK